MSQIVNLRADDLIVIILERVKSFVGHPLQTIDLAFIPREAYEWLQDHDNRPFIPESDTGKRILNPELKALLKSWL